MSTPPSLNPPRVGDPIADDQCHYVKRTSAVHQAASGIKCSPTIRSSARIPPASSSALRPHATTRADTRWFGCGHDS